MRIAILALGSRGDVQPFVPLGQALQAAGHRVRVVTFANFAPLLQQAGLEFAPVPGDAEALVKLAFTERPLGPRAAWQALQRSYGQLAHPALLAGLVPAFRDADLLLNQLPSHLIVPDLAEYLGRPWAVAAVIPLVRSRYRPLVGAPALPIPGYNLLTYRLGEQLGWQMFRGAINRWRRGLGLRPRPWRGFYEAMHQQRVPFLNGFSEQVVPRPPDWGAHIHTTGWWLPREPAWEPPAELTRFIEAGRPPVFIGFGSMPVGDPARVTALLVDAVRQSGQRAILHAGWAGLGGALPPEIFPIPYAPYRWLFPQMAAIVHHGGSGTTGFGFHSGVPSLIVPFVFDQFYWGRRAAELGVGPAPVPYRELSAARLAAAIRSAVDDPAKRARAADLGRRLAAEDGLGRAVEIISRLG